MNLIHVCGWNYSIPTGKNISNNERTPIYKGQTKPKADWRAADSPKKCTNEFVFVAFLLFMGKKTNLIVRFLGESTARKSAFCFIWPLTGHMLGGIKKLSWIPQTRVKLMRQNSKIIKNWEILGVLDKSEKYRKTYEEKRYLLKYMIKVVR